MHRISHSLDGLALCALLLAGCGGDDARSEAEPAPDESAATPSDTSRGPAPATGPGAALPGLALPVILERVYERTESGELAVLDDMIPPLRTSVATVRNRHDPAVTDTVRTLHYGGLEMEVYEVTSTGKEIVRKIVLTGEAYDTGLGFAVGATRQQVIDAMGEPARREGSTLYWELTGGERDPTPTELAVDAGSDDRVRTVTWEYYVD